MRFLHTSDWHIGKRVSDHILFEDQVYILDQIFQIAKEQSVDLIVMAGDIYDKVTPEPEAVELLDEALTRLVLDLKCPVFMISGNHDSAERLGFGSRILAREKLQIVSSIAAMKAPFVFSDEHGPIDFWGIPYFSPPEIFAESNNPDVRNHEAAMAWCLKEIAAKRDPQRKAIAVAHGFVLGGEANQTVERGLPSVGGTGMVPGELFSSFIYTALGHLHKPQDVKGSSLIRYSGSILSHDISECGKTKSVSIVDIDAKRNVTAKAIDLKPKRQMRIVKGLLEDIIASGKDDSQRDDYVFFELDDQGALIDPVARLQKVYNRVMGIERSAEKPQGAIGPSMVSFRSDSGKSNSDFFKDFYVAVTGKDLAEESIAKIRQELEDEK